MTTEVRADLKTAVLNQLSEGNTNAIIGKDIAQRLGQHDTRKIRLCIEALIEENGEPICSTPHNPPGYFLAKTPQEGEQALRTLKYGYGLKIFRHYNALKKALQKKFPQQIDIPHGQLRMKI